jgi:tetratricopeptide (TPR) repeat protein
MSYINDALRKLQKEKKTRYVAYDDIISAPRKKSEPSQKWLPIIGILIVCFFVAGIIVFLYGNEDKKVPAIQRISAPPVAPTVLAEPEPNKKNEDKKVPAIQKISAPPVAPTVLAELEPNKKVESKQLKTKEKVRTKQEIAESKAFFTQALQKQSEGKLEEAKGLYKKVIKIDPRNIQALNNLGVIYMSKKTYKWAIIRFNDAISIKHDYTDAHYNLACLYAQKNDIHQSMFYLKNAIKFNPEVRKWAKDDGDLKALANLPEFKKLVERQ